MPTGSCPQTSAAADSLLRHHSSCMCAISLSYTYLPISMPGFRTRLRRDSGSTSQGYTSTEHGIVSQRRTPVSSSSSCRMGHRLQTYALAVAGSYCISLQHTLKQCASMLHRKELRVQHLRQQLMSWKCQKHQPPSRPGLMLL